MIAKYRDLKNRKILVTGGSSGIGAAVAQNLAKSGAKVVLVARDKDKILSVLSSLSGEGHRGISYDLSNNNSFDDLFTDILEDNVGLSGMVHSAGAAKVLPIKLLTHARVNLEMQINYFAFLELVRQYVKQFNNESGSIVAISSIASTQPEVGQTNYAASKAAMDVAIASMAQELAPKKIRINSILPGVTNTQLLWNNNSADMDAVNAKQLLGIAEPDDIANACLFLLSDASRMMTGRKLYIDGGRL
jgi:NAD(P)-dependent dehydrogenase (short-subunit alcohol dehydrogenase family)